MSEQDPIANLLSSIKNAQTRLKKDLTIPSSNKKEAIVRVLQEEGYVQSYKISEETMVVWKED